MGHLVPVFGSEKGGWFFWGIDGELAGPYDTRNRAEAKYAEYLDYVDGPACHHL